MNIFLKIIAIPFIIALSIIVPFLYFIFGLSEWICTAAAVLVAGAGVIMLATGYSVFSSVGLIIIGFLISPFGLRAVIEWFIDRPADLNDSLKGFVVD